VRTRMRGAVGAEGEKPPATRLDGTSYELCLLPARNCQLLSLNNGHSCAGSAPKPAR
jgi:hypothetical protein